MYRLMLSRKVPLIMHAYYMWRAHNFMIKLGFTFLVHFLNAKVWPHWQLLPVYYLDSYVLSSKVSRVQRVVWPAEGIIGLIAPLYRRHTMHQEHDERPLPALAGDSSSCYRSSQTTTTRQKCSLYLNYIALYLYSSPWSIDCIFHFFWYFLFVGVVFELLLLGSLLISLYISIHR